MVFDGDSLDIDPVGLIAPSRGVNSVAGAGQVDWPAASLVHVPSVRTGPKVNDRRIVDD